MPPDIPKKLVCREYLQQQIYVDPDTIIDRMNTVKLHAPGSGKIIDEMLNTFCIFAEKYQFADDASPYLSFIEDLAEQLGFESQDAIDHFNKRFNDMQKGKVFDQSIYFMTVLSSIIESFQKKVISRLSLRLKRNLAQRGVININEKLETLFQTSNSTFGLLVNIEILKEMSRLIGVEMEPIMTDSFHTELISVLEDM
ncbi:MAG: hypothetical protein ACXADY_12710 [Candidatus Hodarchaeales archaeon]|jgi:hypothetical protein